MFLILPSIHSIFDTPFAESAEGGKMEKRSHFPRLFSVWLISLCCGVMEHFTPSWTYIHTSSTITCTTWQLPCNVSRGVLSSHLTRMLLCWRCFCRVSLCLPGCDYMAACKYKYNPSSSSFWLWTWAEMASQRQSQQPTRHDCDDKMPPPSSLTALTWGPGSCLVWQGNLS